MVLVVLVVLVGLVCWWCVAWGIAPCGLVCGCWCVGVHVCVCCMWADAPMVVLVVLVVFPEGAPPLCGLVCWCVGGVCHDGPTPLWFGVLVVLVVLVGLVGLVGLVVCWWCVAWGVAPCGLVCGCWCVGVHVCVCCVGADAPMVVLVVLVLVVCF